MVGASNKKERKLDNYSIVAFFLIMFSFCWIILIFLSDLKKYHNEGDAFGGLTAPIIGFTSSILIYLSFRAQIKANEKIQEQVLSAHHQINFQYLMSELNTIKSEVNNLSKGTEALGSIVLFQNVKHIDDVLHTDLNEFKFSLFASRFWTIEYVLDLINDYIQDNLRLEISEEHSKLAELKFLRFYNTKLKKSIEIIAKWDNLNFDSEELSEHLGILAITARYIKDEVG